MKNKKKNEEKNTFLYKKYQDIALLNTFTRGSQFTT